LVRFKLLILDRKKKLLISCVNLDPDLRIYLAIFAAIEKKTWSKR
jgi:hypothetical protein